MTKNRYGNLSVYLDNSKSRDCPHAAYIFEHPTEVIIAEKAHDIIPMFDRLRQYVAKGFYVAGWISYETGLFLEDRLSVLGNQSYKIPFLVFGVYQTRRTLSSDDGENHWAAFSSEYGHGIRDMELNISREEYEAAVSKIHDYLLAGDIYQVNYTLKSKFKFRGSPESYFAALRKAQRVEYGAFLKADNMSVLSLSPELFFQKIGQKIMARPMKGTCARGRTILEDQQQANRMRGDDKNRAENLMIVDLLRNDLARISSPASVKLHSLYEVEKYRTLFQMTSTIVSEAPETTDIIDIIKSLFPCGSVTGAPKIRAMEIISELEAEPRGIYTGAIGFIAPDGDGCFSVPIRTVTIDEKGQGEMGIGSAIVADSKAWAEYDECLLKVQFATRQFREFELIETLRWFGDYSYLGPHLDRLMASAQYFDFVCNRGEIEDSLNQHAAFLEPDKIWKVRLLLSRTGQISITSSLISPHSDKEKREITLSRLSVDSENPMLFHKTTDRDFYDRELKQHQQDFGSYDVVFLNEKGNVTEGSFNNIFLQKGDNFMTPPIEEGGLNGILRQSLLKDAKARLTVENLTLQDILDADKIFMGNSVRGLVEVSYREV